MAELFSEDVLCQSKLMIVPGKIEDVETAGTPQRWQRVQIKLVSGNRDLMTDVKEDTFLCRDPDDEIMTLIEALENVLQSKRDLIIFEPSEPAFEITLARTHRGGIKVEAWLDAGNGIEGIYTWDAAGIRFMTTEENIGLFIQQVKQEFTL